MHSCSPESFSFLDKEEWREKNVPVSWEGGASPRAVEIRLRSGVGWGAGRRDHALMVTSRGERRFMLGVPR